MHTIFFIKLIKDFGKFFQAQYLSKGPFKYLQ